MTFIKKLAGSPYIIGIMDAEERVDIVDESGKTLYETTKREAHEMGLLHKCVIAELKDEAGRWVLVKPRSHKQDAGQYVSPVGGHVHAGESDEDALRREVAEEIGITDYTYEFVGKSIFNREVLGRKENHFFYVFTIYSKQQVALGDEAESFDSFEDAELKSLIKNHPEQIGDAYAFVLKNFFPDLLD